MSSNGFTEVLMIVVCNELLLTNSYISHGLLNTRKYNYFQRDQGNFVDCFIAMFQTMYFFFNSDHLGTDTGLEFVETKHSRVLAPARCYYRCSGMTSAVRIACSVVRIVRIAVVAPVGYWHFALRQALSCPVGRTMSINQWFALTPVRTKVILDKIKTNKKQKTPTPTLTNSHIWDTH